MMWYSVDITGKLVQDGDYHRLCRQFQQAFIAAGAPPEMALFAQMTFQDNVRKVYFSPGSVPYVRSLIESYHGDPCDCPESDNITLMFGVPNAGWALLESVEADSSETIGKRQLSLHVISEHRTPMLPSRTAATAS
ncbi:MAG TPA: hypothetical protein VFG50_06300 [Rhodothermales bacterium]|nr:hypothetical protein [Rhodothermales bacterium]